jgi:hypothetical protein
MTKAKAKSGKRNKSTQKSATRHVGAGRGAKRKAFEAEVVQELRDLREALGTHRSTIEELVRASNATSLVVGAAERFLDKQFPGWDDGARAAVEKRATLLRERATLARQIQQFAHSEEGDAAAVKAALRIWEVSKELGAEAVDVPLVLSVLIRVRDLATAAAFLDEIRASEIKLEGEVAELVTKLEERLVVLRAAATEVAAAAPALTLVPPESSSADPLVGESVLVASEQADA